MKKIITLMLLLFFSLMAASSNTYAAQPVINQVYDGINSNYVDRPVFTALGFAERNFTDSNVKSVSLKKSSKIGAPYYSYAGTLVTAYEFENLASFPLAVIYDEYTFYNFGDYVVKSKSILAGTTYVYEESATTELGTRYVNQSDFTVGLSNILQAEQSYMYEVNASITNHYSERWEHTVTTTENYLEHFYVQQTGWYRFELRGDRKSVV